MLRAVAKRLIPEPMHAGVGRLVRRTRYFGLQRICPVCGSRVRAFLPHGVVRRADAVCPVCQSRERHRLAWLYLQRRTPLPLEGLRMLHLAPEPELSRRFRAMRNITYVTADIGRHAMVRSDIAALPFPSDSFDVIYCSHVLNMIPSDRPAIRELFRALRPHGWALLQVPIGPGETRELPGTSTPGERMAAFRDAGIFRSYGVDFVERLRGGGFSVQVERYQHELSLRDRTRYGLHDEDLFLCRKFPAVP